MGLNGLTLLCCCFLLLWGFWSTTPLVEAATSGEIDALLELKRSFNDPVQLATWNVRSRFSPPVTSQDPCRGWTGIACDEKTFSVVSITLPKCFRNGSISPSIGLLPSLQTLDLSGNALIGTLPVEITTLRHLSTLNLQRNKFSGKLPPDWGDMESLQVANLWDNQLDGNIPAGLFKAKSLKRLRLDNNNFSGEIPTEIGGLSNLRLFAVSMNALTWSIPPEMGNVTSLRSLFVAFNRLNGTLPASIGGLPKLAHLDLHHNQLHGAIPDAWSNLTHTLLTLNLSDNLLTGTVPIALSQRFNETSFMNNLNLCGAPLTRMCSPSPTLPSAVPNQGSQTERRPERMGNNDDRKSKAIAGIIGGCVGVGAVLLLCLLVCLYRRSYGQREHGQGNPAQGQNWFNPEIQEDRRHGKFELYDERLFKFSFQDIESHAGFLDTAHVAGRGRFATVYRSHFPDGTELALKMFKNPIVTAAFDKEIPMLAALTHKYLLPIKGYYSTSIEKALIYDFYRGGTLHHLLHGYDAGSPSVNGGKFVDPSTLPDWGTRQRIAYGVAQALDYLHRGCATRVVHMDVKSSNILLEAKTFLPRLADYGLFLLVSNNAPVDGHDNLVETEGYAAPEVLATRKYTDKSDVYSFGVVLLELITGKMPFWQEGDRRFILSKWAEELQQVKRGREVMDAIALKTSPFPEYLDRALDLALLCVNESPSARPAMSEVASVLEGLASNPSPLRSPDQNMVNPLLSG